VVVDAAGGAITERAAVERNGVAIKVRRSSRVPVTVGCEWAGCAEGIATPG